MSTEPAWTKSSYSNSEGGNCIEVAACREGVRVRDSKDKAGPQLALTPAGWAEFVSFAAQHAVA